MVQDTVPELTSYLPYILHIHRAEIDPTPDTMKMKQTLIALRTGDCTLQ